ncbi:MAG: hypothetical protein ACI4LD_02145 [Lentihominibacter sp.]
MDFKKKKRTYFIRVIISAIVTLMFISATAVCFASDMYGGRAADISSMQTRISSDRQQQPAYNDKKPLYSRVNSVLVRLSIRRGTARGMAVVNAKSSRKMDEALAVMTFVNKKTGKSRTYNGKMSRQGNRYSFMKDCRLSQKGVYYVKVKIQCYNDGKLVETITKTSSDDRYDGK